MPEHLAIEWDGYEARVAVARSRGAEIVIAHAFCVGLLPRDSGPAFADVNVGERIAAALAARQIGRMDTIVSVGRASIELRLLTLPPASDEELPDMVRFQATRQFSTLGDDWALDYIPVGATPEGGRSVLAAAISPKLVAQIQRICQAAELKPGRIVLRPFAAASLLCRREQRSTARVRLMVDMLTDEADLTVLIDRCVVFVRTVRLPGKGEASEQSAELIAQVRRTMAAAQNQLGGQRVESLVLCSAGAEHATLKKSLEQTLSLPVELFEPFEGMRLARELQSHPPDAPGRFAPLLGMLLDEADKNPHAIDFLHPRRKPEPPNRRKAFVLAAAVAAVFVLAILGYVWLLFSDLGSQRERLTTRLRGLEAEVKAARRSIDRLGEIEKWTLGDTVWLDELHELSRRAPPAEEAIVEQLQATSRTQGGGAMLLDGLVSTADVIERIEKQIRDPKYSVTGTGSHRDDDRPGYGWRYRETIVIEPHDEELEEASSGKREATRPDDDRSPPGGSS